MTPEPIPRRKLYQEVMDRLLARINAGEFSPGGQLPSERELMDAYAVGRPAIREAMQQLERSGIITISHGERARIARPTAESMVEQMADAARYLLSVEPRTLEHLKEARVFLEAGLAKLAAERVDAAGLACLRQRLDEHREASLDEFLKRDIAFHRQIAAMSGNPIFPAIVEGMLTWLGDYYHSLVRAQGVESLTLHEHQRIYDAIAAGNAAEAAQAMADHLNRASDLYRPLTGGA
jgi:DNA-binding FadR family transcriptional regulator